MEWLNTYTLHGFGNEPWHRDVTAQENGENVYPGAVPVADVLGRLFAWRIAEAPLFVALPDGPDNVRYVNLGDRKAIVRDDTGDVLGLFKEGYAIHQYEDWLLDNVAKLVDDDIAIGSAGLLRNGARAWVQIRPPETVTGPGGIEYLPWIIAASSADGTLATQYRDARSLAVCDNTLPGALASGTGKALKVRHTRHSGVKIADAREALGIIMANSEAFEAELAELLAIDVSTTQYEAVRDTLIPLPADDNKRGTTVASDKRHEIDVLYQYDLRVAPWKGTGFGVLQAFNTYQHWNAQVRKGADRNDRNRENVLDGKFEANDLEVIKVVRSLCTV